MFCTWSAKIPVNWKSSSPTGRRMLISGPKRSIWAPTICWPSRFMNPRFGVSYITPALAWTLPFAPTERNGNLHARGNADDKGQMYMHIKAVEALRAVNGRLPVNLKFLIEGEEEVGGASIASYIAENPEKLRADVAVVSDTA